MAHQKQHLQKSIFEKISTYLGNLNNKDLPVNQYLKPEALQEKIDFSIDSAGTSEEEFLHLLQQYLDYSVKTGHTMFFNQLYSGFNPPAFYAEIITALTNTSMSTYEVAPVATLIEQEMIRFFNTYTGYTAGEGIFLTGGSNANLIAMFSARNRIQPESRNMGYDNNQQLLAFANEHAHYSIKTAANLLGIGTNQVIAVASDKSGRMIPAELEKAILKGLSEKKQPFFVAATCGSTIRGSFDPLEEIAAICQRHKIWFHADGALGGSFLLSEQHRKLMQGIDKTDSFTWDPHKLMNIPLVCSVLLVKQKGTLGSNLTNIDTDYIYHENEAMNDLGEKSIQCGRRVDAVKVWLALKHIGLDAYQKRLDNLMKLAEYAEQRVAREAQLEQLVPRTSITICFRYLPLKVTEESTIDAFNLKLRERLRKSGQTLVNYAHVDGKLSIRLALINGLLEKTDIDQFFTVFIREGKNIEKQEIDDKGK